MPPLRISRVNATNSCALVQMLDIIIQDGCLYFQKDNWQPGNRAFSLCWRKMGCSIIALKLEKYVFRDMCSAHCEGVTDFSTWGSLCRWPGRDSKATVLFLTLTSSGECWRPRHSWGQEDQRPIDVQSLVFSSFKKKWFNEQNCNNLHIFLGFLPSWWSCNGIWQFMAFCLWMAVTPAQMFVTLNCNILK